MTVDAAWKENLAGLLRYHGARDGSWVHRYSLFKALESLHKQGSVDVNGSTVMVHSVEVWNDAGEIVAGEVGYSAGGIYTAMSGWHGASSSGWIQMFATAIYLASIGFKLLDLGMMMEYKKAFGAIEVPRRDFAIQVLRNRSIHPSIPFTLLTRTPAVDILRQAIPPPATKNPSSKRQRKKMEKINRRKAAKARKSSKETKDKIKEEQQTTSNSSRSFTDLAV